MRVTRYFFALIVFVMVATLSNVQAQSAKKMLVRTWIMSFDEMVKKMPAEQLKMIEAMPDEQKDTMRNQINRSYFQFRADGTLEASLNGKKEPMTWKLSAGGKELITTEINGTEVHFKIVELSKKRLILKAKEDIPPIVFVPKQ